MVRMIVAAYLIVLSFPVYANWSVREGRKISPFPPTDGMIATVAAKAPDRGVTARLHIECFTRPDLTILTFSFVLSEEATPGPISWRYQFDEQGERKVIFPVGIPSRTNFLIGDSSSANFRLLTEAKRLRLTFMPTDSPELTFDFDVAGAEEAIKSIPCKESWR